MKVPERVKRLERKPAPILASKFGPLQGIRVLQTATLIAAPHAGTMLADFGAEVIHVENPGVGDNWRLRPSFIPGNGTKVSTAWAENARNRLSIELDLRIDKNPKSKEIFLGLIKSSDIWIENLVWLEQRYGITDELVRQVNPSITVVHESGYGKPQFGGDHNKCWRASYDLIGQAYGSWCHLVGEPDAPPTKIGSAAIDYLTAYSACLGSLMGYIDVMETSEGQVVDAAQFETTARILGDSFSRYFNLDEVSTRTGNKSPLHQPKGIFRTTDGYVAVAVSDAETFRRFLQAMGEVTGLNPDDYPWAEVNDSPETLNSYKGKELDRVTTEWIADHTGKALDALFEKYQVPCAPVYNAKDACEDPHWIKRGNFVECVDQTIQKKVKIFGIIPKFSKTPGKVWRGAPAQGGDTEDILTRILDYTPEEVMQLRREKIICG